MESSQPPVKGLEEAMEVEEGADEGVTLTITGKQGVLGVANLKVLKGEVRIFGATLTPSDPLLKIVSDPRKQMLLDI